MHKICHMSRCHDKETHPVKLNKASFSNLMSNSMLLIQLMLNFNTPPSAAKIDFAFFSAKIIFWKRDAEDNRDVELIHKAAA